GWSGSPSWRPLHARAAQGDAEKPEERRRHEEARVPLVVAGASSHVVDLALLQAVEHVAEASLQRFLVGRRVIGATGEVGDLLEQLGIDVERNRLVRGAGAELGPGGRWELVSLA